MPMRVSDYIAKFIYDYGVKNVFMVSGGGIMHLTDGLSCHKDLKVVCCHHEQAASMALEAYSRASNHFGVGYFTTGPGATNALTGLAGAWLDSVPCLFISGQAKKKETVYKAEVSGLRQFGVQEINILPVVKSLTKYAAFIDNPEDIKYHLEKALYFAKNGRPGPVWLDMPIDIQGALIEPENLKGFDQPEKEEEILNSDLQQVISYIKSSSRPVILAGQGIRASGAIDVFLSFIEKYKIPVVTTYLGIDVIDSIHPQYTGRIGIKGDRAGNLAMQNSDLLIVIGSSLPVAEIGYEYDKFAQEAKIIVVDVDISSHQKKTIKIDLLLKGDAKEFFNKTSRLLEGQQLSGDKNWPDICLSWRNKYPVCLPEYGDLKDKINIYYFIDKLSQKLNAEDVAVTDAGSAFYAGSQAIKIKQGMRYITSGGLATMGYSLPASIGVSIALGNKRVICVTGDGSLQQNIQELQTVKHYNLPIKIFVLNNDGYLSIRFTQKKYFNGRFIGESPISGVSFPDLEKIAQAYEIKFTRINNNGQLDQKLEEVLSYDGPVICEIMAPRDQLIIPTIASEKKEDGRMVSKPLEDMYPFLDRDEFKKEMIIKNIENQIMLISKKVLVTGATGFVGANLVRRLISEGYEVHIITRKNSNKWRLTDILQKLNDYTVDLTELEKLKEVVKQINPDIIFHLATAGIYGGFHLSEKHLVETNILGTINLINACGEIDYKCFINTGSSSEYGIKESPMKETDICNPVNIYGVTKCVSTLYASMVAKTENKPIITFRLFSPFGAYDDKSRLMSYVITNALQNKELNLANPEAARDYIYIEDVIDLYLKAIDVAAKFRGEVFNVGSGSQASISYVVNKIVGFTGSKSLIKWNSAMPRFFDVKRWEADINKTRKFFDWQPKHFIDEGISETISWFRENLFFYADKNNKEEPIEIKEKIFSLIEDFYQSSQDQKKIVAGEMSVSASGKVFDENELKKMVEAVLDCWWTEGRFSEEFAKKLSQKIGIKFCLPVNSGSSANLLAISALTSYKLGERRLKAGDEVITLAAGFPTTVSPIIINNLVPVFVDLDLATYNINIKALEEAISEKTKAIFIAHTLGNPFEIDKVLEICRKHDLWLIEDNCDALGSKYNNKYTGSFGHLATLSFYPAHHITSGEGGAVLTNDPFLAKIIRSLRDWGRDCWCSTGNDNSCGQRFSQKHGNLPIGYDHKYVYSELGYNLKWTDMQAALALVQLEKLDDFTLKRRQNFDYLAENLKSFDKYFYFFHPEENSQPSWFGFLITLKENCPFNREVILKYLNDNKIGTRLLFTGNIVNQPCFTNQKINYRVFGDLKNSNYVMENTFWIGCYHGLNKEKLDYVINKFKIFLEKYN